MHAGVVNNGYLILLLAIYAVQMLEEFWLSTWVSISAWWTDKSFRLLKIILFKIIGLYFNEFVFDGCLTFSWTPDENPLHLLETSVLNLTQIDKPFISLIDEIDGNIFLFVMKNYVYDWIFVSICCQHTKPQMILVSWCLVWINMNISQWHNLIWI